MIDVENGAASQSEQIEETNADGNWFYLFRKKGVILYDLDLLANKKLHWQGNMKYKLKKLDQNQTI